MSIIGTTDDDFYGDLDDVRATSVEVRYLVQGVAKVLPHVRGARIIGTYAGVRPTLHAYGKLEDALSRDHQVVDHAAHGAPGLYSMIGGKLASFRLFAEEMTDAIAARLDVGVRCATHSSALPGGDVACDTRSRSPSARASTPSPRGALVYRHGARAERVEERMRRRPREARHRVRVRARDRGRGALRRRRGARARRCRRSRVAHGSVSARAAGCAARRAADKSSQRSATSPRATAS